MYIEHVFGKAPSSLIDEFTKDATNDTLYAVFRQTCDYEIRWKPNNAIYSVKTILHVAIDIINWCLSEWGRT